MFRLRLVDRIDGEATEFDGQYLVDYDPTPRSDGDEEYVLIVTTDNPDEARQFRTLEEALAFYRQESLNGPGPDGRPDRPLTAYTVEVA
jgi:hypothetical protein